MDRLERFKREVRDELERDILPFWTERMQEKTGGFLGRIDGRGRPVPDAPKGAILNARILWTFATAYRVLGDTAWRAVADRAFIQVRDHFQDPDFGGIYWSLDAQGRPLDTRKQFYALAFAVYGLAGYYHATGSKEALDLAVRLYRDIEAHSLDRSGGGYLEAAQRDWSPIADMRLSEKDRNDAKTMNTHLHILEAYTALYRVWPDEGLRMRLTALVELFLTRFTRPDGHLTLFFDEEWKPQSTLLSFGHEIETSWLLPEAAEALGCPGLSERVKECSMRLADASMEGLQDDGSLIYETDPAVGASDTDRHWWVQAEMVAGCLCQFRLRGEPVWLERALACWSYIREHLICPDGEWYWSVRADGSPNTLDDRAGFWKCPYHNGRMCMEILERA